MGTPVRRSGLAGLLLGFGLFFLCYWWLGTITLSAVIGGVVAALVALLGRSGQA